MKKILSFVLAAIMLSAAALTGCTGGEKGVDKIVLATGGNTGTYYAYGMAMGPILAEKTGIKFDVQSTGASKANIQLIQLGEADMAVVQNDVMYYAYTGTDLFTDAQTQDFAALAVLYPELCQIIATKDSGITTVADLKGKRVSVGDAGSGVEFNAKQILEVYGIDMDNDIQKQNLGFGPSADALKDGKIDAFFCVAGIPTTAITDLAMSKDITVVAVEDEKFQELSSKYGFYTQQVVPKETYNGMTEDVKTVAVMATYIVDKDLPEDVVYNITKSIFENKDAIAKAHTKGLELDLYKAIAGIPAEVPLHAGAAKYYEEEGVSAENVLSEPVKELNSLLIWAYFSDSVRNGTNTSLRGWHYDGVAGKPYMFHTQDGSANEMFIRNDNTEAGKATSDDVVVTDGKVYAAMDIRTTTPVTPKLTLVEYTTTAGEEVQTEWKNFYASKATKGDGTWERVVIEIGNVGDNAIEGLTGFTKFNFAPAGETKEGVSVDIFGLGFFNDKYSAVNYELHSRPNVAEIMFDVDGTVVAVDPDNAPAKEGFTFKGWSTALDGSAEIVEHAAVTKLPVPGGAPVTYYAIFEEVAAEGEAEVAADAEVAE